MRNPVDALKDQLTQVLAEAKLPFTPEQEKQLALLIEEERQAAENLFGSTWDFSKGPPQGELRDQALAGIQWMYEELKKKIPAYMTEGQRAAWERYESSQRGEPEPATGKIQQIRVTNNAFNVETATVSGVGGPAGGGAKTEVIERGGAGGYHGNFASIFQDDKLNARNPFAGNKPPYYERTIYGNVSGPVLRNRLSVNLTVTDNRQENVGTVKAETPDGPFSLGVTRPTFNRSYDARSIVQITDAHSLNVGLQYATRDSRNENVGDFSLPERASRTRGRNHVVDLRQISILSERSVHDMRVTWRRNHSQTDPFSNALTIIVKDAFTGGGAQNKSRIDEDTYELSNLFYFAGEKLIVRTGFQARHVNRRSFSQENFFGEFTFSDLASYREGAPLKYRITCCDPSYEISQTQFSLFSQNDLKVTNTFTLMLGLRYQLQSNIRDRNNVDPRIGFAYAIGNSTVLRGGAGIFSQWFNDDEFEAFSRLDGRRLYEIQLDNPGWPNPFTSGTQRPRSRYVIYPHMRSYYIISSQVALERSLPHNLFVTVAYDINRGVKPTRTRDLNAPHPETGIRPFPAEGHRIQLQSTGLSLHQHLKASLRQRFSIFSMAANYTYYRGYVDGPNGRSTGLPSNSYDLHQDWGRNGSPEHTFAASVNSRLPLDVYLTTAISAKSGTFYTITTGKDDNGDGIINDRPPAIPKNSVPGPHYFDVSFNVSKAFQLTDRGAANSQPQMNVFANLNNAFNMTHLGVPSGVMTSPFFGKSYNAVSPRTVEVGMRFQF